MKSALAIGLATIVIAGCGTDQKTAEQAPAVGSAKTAQVRAYPIDWCVVSGEKLGDMGEPVTKTYGDREVKFCCKHCVEEFEKTPALYLAKIDSAAAGQLQPPAHDEHGG